MANDYFNDNSNDLSGNGIIGGHILDDNTTVEQQRVQFPQKLDATQNDPRSIKSIDFKQDYTVLIRKKKYYAVNQSNEELYVKIYQVNNFINISTSHRVNGTGSCKIQIKGGERVIAADKTKVKTTDWGSFEEIKAGWNNIDDEGRDSKTGIKWSSIDGTDYKSLINARQAKYYWKYAEKADWEPMDEVYVFAKSKVAKTSSNQDSQYKFVQIFFGYITSVSKSYSSPGNLTINIDVEDHLKLLRISRMFTRPPFDMSVAGTSVRYDGFGQMIVEDEPNEMINSFNNFFAGLEPQDIIRQCAVSAGIPMKYLTGRIEEIKRVPFAPQLQNGNYAELFRSDWKTRLAFCQEAADKLNLEFFADESGNIVLKIPSYAVGINKMSSNYEGTPGTSLKIMPIINTSAAEVVLNDIKNGMNGMDDSFGVNYTVQKGDSLQAIALMFYGDRNRWQDIWNLNIGNVRHPESGVIEPGEIIVIKIAKANVDQAVSAYRQMKRNEYANDSQPLSTVANDSLSAKYDYLIRTIEPEEIIAFTITDSDADIFTAAQVSVEYTLLDSAMKQLPPAVTRAVQDFDLIRQFGFRLAPAVNTPIAGGPTGAAMYAGMIILRSLSGRFTGSITMIEESTIRVGDPIRFHSYDEHPRTEMIDPNTIPAQSVYYVESISRSINPSGVSTMTLSLKAGRNFAQPSIYDNCQELYRGLYEDVAENNSITNPARDSEQELKAQNLQNDVNQMASQTYTVKSGDSLSKIASEYYNNADLWTIIFDANRDQISKPNLIIPGMKLKIPSSSNKKQNEVKISSSGSGSSLKIGLGSHSLAESKATQLGLIKTSGYRTPQESIDAGGTGNDDHTKGLAEDFAGAPGAMNEFAMWAQYSGMFVKVIWQGRDLMSGTSIAGHYDHVHVSWSPQ